MARLALARCATRGAPETAKATAVGISARLWVLKSFRSERARVAAPTDSSDFSTANSVRRFVRIWDVLLRAPLLRARRCTAKSLHDTLRSLANPRNARLRACLHTLCCTVHCLLALVSACLPRPSRCDDGAHDRIVQPAVAGSALRSRRYHHSRTRRLQRCS